LGSGFLGYDMIRYDTLLLNEWVLTFWRNAASHLQWSRSPSP